MAVVGIRREDKSVWERRTPIVPEDVRRLVAEGVAILVERSPTRCFTDAEFAAAGARLADDLSAADIVLGVKEIPLDRLAPGKTYAFFSHTIKGQPYNMPMLRRMLDLGATLLDYELVTDERGARTVAFGRHAGLAGAVDTLWALGRRFAARGIDTPFAGLRPAVEYGEMAKAAADIGKAGARIVGEGLPEEISPLAVGVTGSGGKVYGGAMEVLAHLPHRRVRPADLAAEMARHTGRAQEVLVVGYGPEDLVEPVRPGATYSWEHYLVHPEDYRACFGAHLAHLTAVIHGIFWKEGYPRFILREDLAALSSRRGSRLQLITDVTCDLGGSDEALVRLTDPGNPVYVFDPRTGEAKDGFYGEGVAVIAIDILPSELPIDASRHFSGCLSPLLPALARGVPDPGDGSVPGAIRRAIIAHRGRLVSPWDERLAVPLERHGSAGLRR
jgi:alpha-aminoadipic semialdehyde synthase